jgi:hypothetical protein
VSAISTSSSIINSKIGDLAREVQEMGKAVIKQVFLSLSLSHFDNLKSFFGLIKEVW